MFLRRDEFPDKRGLHADAQSKGARRENPHVGRHNANTVGISDPRARICATMLLII